jgi:HSP20 family protein
MYAIDGELLIEMELPGVEPTDVEIQCHGLEVAVRALSTEPRAPSDAVIQERRRGAYERTLAVSPDWNPSGARASFQDGVLTLRLPAAPAPEGPRRIHLEMETSATATLGEPERAGTNGNYRLDRAILLPTMIGGRLDEDEA